MGDAPTAALRSLGPTAQSRGAPGNRDARRAGDDRQRDRPLPREQADERAAHGVHAAFAWQPVPTYKYDLAHHDFHSEGFGRVAITRVGYPEMARVAQAGAGGANFVWCADIQEGRREELYLDLVHYAPRMARRVAACIAKGLLHRHLLAKHTNAPAAPTV